MPRSRVHGRQQGGAYWGNLNSWPLPAAAAEGTRAADSKEGGIFGDPDSMPDEIQYDESRHRLLVGRGIVVNVRPEVWHYEVSGKRVVSQWFTYRKRNRERPIIGDRRPPSKLGEIQPEYWLAEYTTELLNVLHVLSLLVETEPAQAQLLEEICDGATLGFRQ